MDNIRPKSRGHQTEYLEALGVHEFGTKSYKNKKEMNVQDHAFILVSKRPTDNRACEMRV